MHKALINTNEAYGPASAAEIVDKIEKLKNEAQNSVEIQKVIN